MRLHPALSKEEILEYLTMQAKMVWGEERFPALESQLEPLAEAMAAISACELPDELEPLFP
jgi:hypothetical protein